MMLPYMVVGNPTDTISNVTKKIGRVKQIELWDETRERVSEMCNLSQGLKEWAKEEEQENTILRLLKNGKGIDIMVAATGWTIERVQTFLKSRNLQPV